MQTAERDAASPGGTSGSEGSPTMTESHSESPQSTNKSQAFDLFNLVVSYKRIEIYLEPVKDTWDGIKYLLRWQMPICSLFTCFTLNVLLLTLNEVAWFSVGALFISIPALFGYLQEMSQVHLPEPELARRKSYSVRREELQKVKLSRQEAVAEFKNFLIHLEGILNMICGSCEKVYQVLYWQNPSISFQFYGLLLGSVCILYLLPLYWVLALINSTLFLRNSDFYRVVAECKASLQQKSSSESAPIEPTSDTQDTESGIILDRTPTPVPASSEDLSPGSVEEAEEAEPDDEFKDAIEEDDDVSQCPVEYDISLQDNGFLSKNEVIRSKVSKLTEKLRKRYPANNLALQVQTDLLSSIPDEVAENLPRVCPDRSFYLPHSTARKLDRKKMTTNVLGKYSPTPCTFKRKHREAALYAPGTQKFKCTCTGCNANFSVLKKRRSCSNCGNSFCSRCCSYKVPKSVMGATAPDAQRETVFVCAVCNQALSK